MKFRPVNKVDQQEMRIIAEADSRIPLEFDPIYKYSEASIDQRLEYYKQLKDDDFFEVIEHNGEVIGFHMVKKVVLPPNPAGGNVLSLWVHPDHRGKGLAAKMKTNAEAWARQAGLAFLQTNVHTNNKRMMKINQSNGYELAYINLRKTL